MEVNKMIKSISYDQDEIIQNIIDLYCPDGIELDPTYSKGNFYKKIKEPFYKFDLEPKTDMVHKADCRNLPIEDNSINSIMFDPPFVGGSRKDGKPGIIKTRFGYYKNIPTLWEMYIDALEEFKRILKPNGILIFKCQDSIESGKQYLSEFKIIKEALEIGFYPKDKFILLAKNRLMSPNMKVQKHARKFHCYFLVFINKESSVKY
jgi:tRNA G10  N-methylase Trm11